MILPVLAPVPGDKAPGATDDEVHFGKFDVSAGGNRGRGQVYPDGNISNNNVFLAPEPGKVVSIEGDIEKKDGTTYTKELLAGADVVVEVGDQVTKDMQL